MARIAAHILLIVGVMTGQRGLASAQPEPTYPDHEAVERREVGGPEPADAGPRPGPGLAPVGRPQFAPQTNGEVHQLLLQTSPEYRVARSDRTTGIVLTSLGGITAVLGIAMGLGYAYCNAMSGDAAATDDDDCAGLGWLTLGGLGLGTVGLAVGVTMTVRGHREMKRMRYQALTNASPWPRVSVAPGRGGGLLRLGWTL